MSTQIKHLTFAPEALTDSQISAIFTLLKSSNDGYKEWLLQTSNASWSIVKWCDGGVGLYLGDAGVKAWNEHKVTHTEAQIFREAYEIIYKQSL